MVCITSMGAPDHHPHHHTEDPLTTTEVLLLLQITDPTCLSLLEDQSGTASIGSQMKLGLFASVGRCCQPLLRLP